MMEYEVEAELLYEFRRAAAIFRLTRDRRGGANSCILHYNDNNAELKGGDVLLIDAGAEIDSYAADITRSFR